jgi:hypothetical protein
MEATQTVGNEARRIFRSGSVLARITHLKVNHFIFTGSILVLESAVTIPSIPEAID